MSVPPPARMPDAAQAAAMPGPAVHFSEFLADDGGAQAGPVGAGDRRGRLRLRESWALLRPYWVSEDRKAAWGLLALVVGLNLAMVAVNVWMTNWNRVFYNTLEARDFPGFKTALLQFCAIAAVFIVVAVSNRFFTMRLQMRWRTWMTGRFVGRWLDAQAYYRIEQAGSADNPDQRISEDIRSLTSDSLTLSLGLMSSVVTLLSFVTLLWTLSGPLSFTLAGHAVSVPGYMVWAALLYAVAGSWLTHRVGRPLIGLYFRQEQAEAGLRHAMMRLRENAEGVALYRGEPAEGRALRARFGAIRANWHWLMVYMRRLVLVNSGYGQAAIVFPLIVAAPRYFAGKMTLGGLMQISSAFGQVQGALSWFADSYSSLVNWQASANRLLDFQAALAEAAAARATADEGSGRAAIAAGTPPAVGRDAPGAGAAAEGAGGGAASGAVRREGGPGAGDALVAEGLVLGLPDGRALTEPFDLRIGRGERWLVTGPSGAGKSVLFRAAAGIWPYGRGRILHPAGARILFLPQRSYLPAGTLADALCYPAPGAGHDPEALREALRAVRLPALAGRLDEAAPWSARLSPGEQQRLAFARALLQRPDFLFLDEATSALDEDTEAAMYRLLVERLPGTALVSIAHRSTVARWHDRQLRYLPAGDGAGDGADGPADGAFAGGDAAPRHRLEARAIGDAAPAADPGRARPADQSSYNPG
ncbi:MAG: ABC transporter ATP-binding protein/permease [Xylophilus ampelinus]